MSNEQINKADLLRLCGELRDQTISAEGMAKLDSLLGSSKKAQRFFLEFMRLASLLEQRTMQRTRQGDMTADLGLNEESGTNIFLELLEVEENAEDIVVDISDQVREREKEQRRLRSLALRRKRTAQQANEPETRYYVIPRPLFYGSIAAVVAVAATIIWPMIAPDKPETPPKAGDAVQPAMIEPVAELLAAPHAKWAGRAVPIADGSRLIPGTYELESGLAKIRFTDGAQVIIEAPTTIELVSGDKTELRRGRIVGYCPPGSEGFTVLTPNARIIDRGTEFGVSLDDQGAVETHVFNGEVELTVLSNGQEQATEVLARNTALHVDATGTRVTEIESRMSRFLRGEEFAINVKAANGSAYDRWLAYSAKLRRDPSVTVYYTFETGQNDDDPLVNVAEATKDALHGVLGDANRAINNSIPSWRRGRFNEKRALSFNRLDTQRIIVPHDERLNPQGDELTIAAWVRRRGPGNHIGVLVSKYESNDAIFFQFGGYGDFAGVATLNQLQLVTGKVTRDAPLTDKVVPQPDGQWELLAVTHDGSVVRFYRNGEAIGQTPHKSNWTGNDADVVIGAHSPNNPIVNPFDGEMDELVILSRAMRADEIQEMYRQGVPSGQ